MNIRTISQTLNRRLSVQSQRSFNWLTGNRWLHKSVLRKRVVRYGLLSLNVVVLLTVIVSLARNSRSGVATQQSSLTAASSKELAANPLDQLSSADIAAHVALLVNLPESTAVTNQADSFSDQLTVAPADDKVIAKPQIINTTTKTRKDIQRYVTQSGDSVSVLAVKFGVTSDSIRLSNGLSGDSLPAAKELWISPISDGVVYVVKSGDTLQTLVDKFRANQDDIINFNDLYGVGLPVGERIVIPGGKPPVVSTGFSFGFNWFGSAAIYSNNGYDFGWCTWYAANRRTQLGRPVPSNLGNAYSWYDRARSLGLPTGTTPSFGAVAEEAWVNHVSIVEQVNADGSFWVSEMNDRGQKAINDPTPWGGWNVLDYRLIASVGNIKFIY